MYAQKISRIAIWTLLILAFLFSANAFAGQFIAEIFETGENERQQGRIAVSGDRYRIDIVEDGRKLNIVVDQDQGKTRIVIPSEKAFLEIDNTSPQSMMNNPFQSFRFSEGQFERQETGTEIMQGHECRKILIRTQGQDVMTAWFADELGFYLKIVNHLAENMAVELKNINIKPVHDGVFSIPAGFQKLDRMPVPIPDWAQDVPAAPVLSPPFKKELSAGKILRMPVQSGFTIKVEAKNIGESSGTVTSVAFQNGRPIKEPSYSTFSLEPGGGGVTVTHKVRPDEADEIIVRTKKGHFLITPELIEAPEGIILKKDSLKSMSGKELHPVQTKKFLLRITDEHTDSTPSKGDIIFYEGSAQHKKELEKQSFQLENASSRVWEFPAEKKVGTISIDLWQGKIHTRLEQPEKAGATPAAWGRTSEGTPEKKKTPTDAKATTKTRQPSLSNIVFILDASGSMWKQVDGRYKIEIAKEVMCGIIKDLPENISAGLVAYGHRRKGDCSDVEQLVPISPLERKILIEKITSISPKGMTPITSSVRMTANTLKDLEKETTIILVSDGKETCEGDPCELVKKLKDEGLKFVMHVIGFDVTEEERVQLECMAREGGGAYYTAKDSLQFKAAAKKVVQASQDFGYLKVTALRNKTWIRADVSVFDKDSKNRIFTRSTRQDKNWPGIRIKPGTYDLQVTDVETVGSPSQLLKGVTIQRGETLEKNVAFSGGILEITAIKEGKPIQAYIRLLISGEKKTLTSGWLPETGTVVYKLVPGQYDVRVQDNSVPDKPERELKAIEIQAGERITRKVEFTNEGILELIAIKNNKPFPAYIRIYRQEDKKQLVSGWMPKDKPAAYKLLPGIYDIVVEDGSVPSKPKVELKEVAIQPGITIKREAEFVTEGSLEISAIKNNKPFSAYVRVSRQEDKKQLASGWMPKDKPASYKLLPGIYDIVIEDGAVPSKPKVEINGVEVTSGETVAKKAEFVTEGVLEISAFKNGKNFAAYAKVFRQEDKKQLASGWMPKNRPASYKLLPGLYNVELENNSDKTKKMQNDIQVESGQTKNVEIVF